MQPLAQKLADWRHRVRAAAGPVLHPALPAVCPSTLTYSNSSSASSSNSSLCPSRQQRRQPAATSTSTGTAGPVRAAAAAEPLSVGDVVSVSCARLGTGGVGVCLWGPSQLVLLVKGALPGEQLTAVVTAVKKSYAEGSKVSTQQPHSDATPPACQHYGTCGGCSLQALAYPAQLAHKTDYVAQVLRRVGKVPEAEVAAAQQPPVAAEAVYAYRNKVQLAFSSLVWQQQQQQESEGQQTNGGGAGVQGGAVQQGFGLGYFLPGSNSVVLPIKECSLASPEINQVVSEVRQLCQQYGLQPHNTPDSSGVLRHLIIRSAAAGAAGAAGPPTVVDGAAAAAAGAAGPPTVVDGEAGAAAGAAVADTSTPGTAAGVEGGGAGGRKLLAVLVTNSSVSAPAASKHTETALAALAQQLMQRCPSLASVVHSIEAAPPASTERGGPRSTQRNSSSGRGRGRWQQGTSAGRSGRSRDGGGSSDDSSDGSSGRGAQPLRVSSSRVLAGTGQLVEHLCGLQFRVSPHSFFQTNTAQAARLYGVVVQAAAEALVGSSGSSSSGGGGSGQRTCSGAEAHNSSSGSSSDGSGLVLDLYCGTGTIALCLAAALPGRQVVGCDVSASNIADARANAGLNGLANVSFVCGDLNLLQSAAPGGSSSKQQGAKRESSGSRRESVQELQALQPEVVVVDPARAGLGASVVEYLLGSGARRVVYVSCNAATQARDLQLLCHSGGFRLASWTAVDLFPQTDVAHVETVAVLDRTG